MKAKINSTDAQLILNKTNLLDYEELNRWRIWYVMISVCIKYYQLCN